MNGKLADWFSYRAQKFVVVYNSKFFCARIAATLFVLIYAVGYNMLYLGVHLNDDRIESKDFKLTFETPKNWCSYWRLDCQKAARVPQRQCLGTRNGDDQLSHPEKKPCKSLESEDVSAEFKSSFMPTAISRYWRKRNCTEEEVKQKNCPRDRKMNILFANGSVQYGDSSALPTSETYVDQAEQWFAQFDHRVLLESRGDFEDIDMQSHYIDPETGKREEIRACQSMAWGPPKMRSRTQTKGLSSLLQNGLQRLAREAEGSRSAVKGLAESKDIERPECPVDELEKISAKNGQPILQTQRGDRAPLTTILHVAGVGLDDIICHADWDSCRPGFTRRARGMQLKVNVIYENIKNDAWSGLQVTPWSSPDVFYTYEVSLDPTVDNVVTNRGYLVESDTGLLGGGRMEDMVEYSHGIGFELAQVSRVKIFDWGPFGLFLCEAITFMAVLGYMLDLVMTTYSKRYREGIYPVLEVEAEPSDAGDTNQMRSEQNGTV